MKIKQRIRILFCTFYFIIWFFVFMWVHTLFEFIAWVYLRVGVCLYVSSVHCVGNFDDGVHLFVWFCGADMDTNTTTWFQPELFTSTERREYCTAVETQLTHTNTCNPQNTHRITQFVRSCASSNHMRFTLPISYTLNSLSVVFKNNIKTNFEQNACDLTRSSTSTVVHHSPHSTVCIRHPIVIN